MLGFRTMTLWSNRVVGVAAERRRDAQVASWCKEHGIAWHDIPANGVIPHEECSETAASDDFQAFWSHEIENIAGQRKSRYRAPSSSVVVAMAATAVSAMVALALAAMVEGCTTARGPPTNKVEHSAIARLRA